MSKPVHGTESLGSLIGTTSALSKSDQDMRLDDYLNDKIQTTSDFKGLASLLASVEGQRKDLEEQLQQAQLALQQARNASANHTSEVLLRTQEYKQHYDHVQTRLLSVTSSSTPEEAANKMRGPMEKLRRVELARSYVEMLKDVDQLRNEAKKNLPARPKEALKPYTQLKELSLSLNQLQEEAEGAGIHLVSHVRTTTEKLWIEMKNIMSAEFETVLQNSQWPSIDVPPSDEWIECFGKLLDLQTPEILAAQQPLVLLPMEVLARHFVLEFRYHFFTNKGTSSANLLGQYFFDWVIKTVDTYQDFLRSNLTFTLASHFRDTSLAGQSLYVDPVAGFINALLPVVKEKLDSVLSQIGQEPNLLSQIVKEIFSFDQTVRDKFNYDGGNGEQGWKGLSWEVLDKWFPEWSQVEKRFALKRYQEIIKAPNSGDIDYDGAPIGKTKATYGAGQVTDLIATVTTTYNRLRKFAQRVMFLIDIQAEILDQYLGRLNDSLESYQSMTSAVGRTLHGVTREQQASLEGVGGLRSLCKVFGSAEHMVSMLKEWSNEEFFVQLWDELQGRAKSTARDDNLVGSMSYTEVKDVTSNAVGSDTDGSLWDVTIENYERVRQKAEMLLLQAVQYSFPTTFKQYINKPQWTTIGELPPAVSDIAVTSELDLPLQTLSEFLKFLHQTLSTRTYKKILRRSADTLQDLLFDSVLLRQDFTTLGAARLSQDLVAIESALNAYGGSKSTYHMPKLAEGIRLLNLSQEPQEEGEIGLKEASQEMFFTTAQTQQLLVRLNISQLTPFEARSILQRRVEANDLS